MSKGIRQKPSVNFSLFRQVLYAHIVTFLMMLMLGIVFTVLSLVLFYTHGANWLLSLFICPLFLFTGLFITGFAFKSNYSSMSYYYDKGQLKRYGLNLDATLTRKEKVEISIDNAKRRVRVDELELHVFFDFQFDSKRWSGGDLLTNEKVFDALNEGQTIPIRILPWKPESASVRQRALFNRLKGMITAAETTDPRLGEALIEFDEI
ncbi:hypothetical protein [Citrobacter portucalensis]|uniref:hypothetical protein n=1 Tax=Citrobacter portucalensis TaxID=1639133 RepID=UPI00292B07CF|nr:hypothetical protein [Citrobacter freundii]MDV0557882.1 hypothetical protein [Citrobacter portucalensis]MDV0583088.1 hypothetical protein [Citrobacter portucalensis]MEB0659901.1 hypothetical protein [Citrobacter portucalensis]MEB0699878.1 hypothetical protein [Citrobacter portucalensis]